MPPAIEVVEKNEQPAGHSEPPVPPPPQPVELPVPPAVEDCPEGVSSGHARDYRWLIGELQYVQVRDVWCLRYAAADEDDPYGGRVTLLDPGEMTNYRNGQIVRVHGELANPDRREPSPSYRVRSLTVQK